MGIVNEIVLFGGILFKNKAEVVIAIVAGITALGFILGKVKFLTPMLWIFSAIFYFFVKLNKLSIDSEAHNVFMSFISGTVVVAAIATLTTTVRLIREGVQHFIRLLKSKHLKEVSQSPISQNPINPIIWWKPPLYTAGFYCISQHAKKHTYPVTHGNFSCWY